MKKIDLSNYRGSVEIIGDPKNGGWNELVIQISGIGGTTIKLSNLEEQDYRNMAELFLAAGSKLGSFL